MANRANHYEAAFEAYIRSIRVPCVAVDEAKRAIFGQDGVKNPDFLLYPRLRAEPGGRGQGEAGQERARAAALGELGDDRRPRRPGPLAGDVRARLPGDPGVRLRRALAAVPAAAATMGPSRSGGWTIASGRSAWTTTSPTSARAARPGRRWPWPARRSAAGSGRCGNGSRWPPRPPDVPDPSRSGTDDLPIPPDGETDSPLCWSAGPRPTWG